MKFLHALTNVKLWCMSFLLQIQIFSDFVTKWLVGDVGFLKWLAIAMGCDLATGIAKAYRKKESITSKGLRDTVSKCIQYGTFLIITHVLTHFEIGGKVQYPQLEWLNKLSLEFIILIEIKSVYENIVAINPKFDFVQSLWDKVVKVFPAKTGNKS